MNTKISVITVVYNAKDTIERTIKSVIDQQYDNYEYIIIDGGSTDGTLEVIEKYRDKISYFISESDEGIYDAMNKGVLKATGDYVAFINANDWYEPNAFRLVASYIKTKNTPIVYVLVKKHEKGKEKGYIGLVNEEYVERLHFENLYCHQGLFIKRDLFDKFGLYNTKYKMLADYEWILTLHDKGINPDILKEDVSNFTAGGISSSQEARYEYYDIISKHYYNHPLFSHELELQRGLAEFNIMFNSNQKVLSEYFIYENYVIWGCGEYGEKCYKLINNANKNVIGFVDSSKASNTYQDIIVWSPEEIFRIIEKYNNDLLIFVATSRYEKEIFEKLIMYGIQPKLYDGISSIFKWSYNRYYMDREDFHVL